MLDAFDVEKAVQVAAKFTELNGGSIDRYALIKMVYNADRKACKKWGHSMTGDIPVAMEHGPVLSRILDLSKGIGTRGADVWGSFLTLADEDCIISLKTKIDGFDQLSVADCRIIEESFAELRGKTFKQLKAWSHSLAEYGEDVPKGEMRLIPPEKRLHAVGMKPTQISVINQENEDSAMMCLIFGSK